ncbi:MAG TPA: endonuclease/exonuclease/phosphatase family protein [Longimicrobiales bacterium]|nr:endonuclease/exonuclease/phosphatase family protein [Longimicrobiales bacterium]
MPAEAPHNALPRRASALLRRSARLLLIAICAGTAACGFRGSAQPLRVMSYNIAAGHGDLAAIATVIREADPDIVALQEVDVHWSERSGLADQAAALADALGMHVRFAPIYHVADDPPREFGLAILSRYPVVEFTNHVIPRLSTQVEEAEPRPMPGFPQAVVDIGGTRIHVFDTHLDYRADPRVRVQQVAAMLRVMENVAAPVILMGDLNAQPDAPELQPLFGLLRDAWRDGGGDGAGYTYPGESPVRRIDYVMTSGHFEVRSAMVPVTTASDHRPVVVELVMR